MVKHLCVDAGLLWSGTLKEAGDLLLRALISVCVVNKKKNTSYTCGSASFDEACT